MKRQREGAQGRRSAAASTIEGSALGAVHQMSNRPDAPYDLAGEELAEWLAIVYAMPPEHFSRVHFPMLAQFCRHVVASRRIGMLVQQECAKPKFDLAKYRTLLSMQAAEFNQINRLARSMRLTQQAIWRSDSARARPLSSPQPLATIEPPWNWTTTETTDRDYDAD